MNLEVYVIALATIAGVAVLAWIVSVIIQNVSFVDVLWPVFFLLSSIVCAASTTPLEGRSLIVIVLVILWAVRLALHIGWRNWGEPEDYRYQQIRENNQPFAIRSLYIVFGLQGFLAWIISLPLVIAIARGGQPGILDSVAIMLWLVGFLFEAVGDHQLKQFKNDPANDRKVMDSGLWHYTRHPNYFGDFCVWWAFFLFAVAAGGWWTVLSPLLMTFLLLKVSGVAMLEKSIANRRPKYADYVERTNAFFPGPRKKSR